MAPLVAASSNINASTFKEVVSMHSLPKVASSHKVPASDSTQRSPSYGSPLIGRNHRSRQGHAPHHVESFADRVGAAGSSKTDFFEPVRQSPETALTTLMADLLMHGGQEAASTSFAAAEASISASPAVRNEGLMGDVMLEHVESMNSLFSHTANNAPEVKALETATLDVVRDQEGNKVINNYVVIGDIGRGSYGKVKLCEHRVTKEIYAIKILNKSMLRKIRNGAATALQQVQTEIAIMKKLRHRNIVNLYEVIDDPGSNKMYLVMQYVPNGPVLKLQRDGTCDPLDLKTVRNYARQLAAGINYLHRHNVVHRDIKPDNILLGERDTVYLADFGVSEMLDEDSELISGFQGTPAFMSPELCRGEGSVHGKAVDMWALGATLFALIFGKLPFYGGSVSSIAHAIQNDALVFPMELDLQWRDLLSALLNKDPNRRMTASELRVSPVLFAPQPHFTDGAPDVNELSTRRPSALDVVTIDEDDIENAIAVGSRVTLSRHRSPRERFQGFVETIRRRVRNRSCTAVQGPLTTDDPPRCDIVVGGIGDAEVVIITPTSTGNYCNSDSTFTPHPPSPTINGLPVENEAPQVHASSRKRASDDESNAAGLLSPNAPHAVTGASLRVGSRRASSEPSFAIPHLTPKKPAVDSSQEVQSESK